MIREPSDWRALLKTDLLPLPRLKDKSANDHLISSLVEALGKKIDVFEHHILSKQSYMAGDTFSLIDIFYMPLTAYIFTMGYGDIIESRPHMQSWWKRVSSRPSWKTFGSDAQVVLPHI